MGSKALVELNGKTVLAWSLELFLGLDEVGQIVVPGPPAQLEAVRRVGRLDRRLQEARRRGLNRAIVPAGQNPRVEGMELVEVRELSEAIEVAFPAREASSAIMV